MPDHDVPDDPREYLPGGDAYAIDQPGVLAYFADHQKALAAGKACDDAGLGPVSIQRFHPQSLDRARLDQEPQWRLDIENHVDAGLPLDPKTQATTVVAVAARDDAARRALRILREHGGRV